jgi:hypothetical protein
MVTLWPEVPLTLTGFEGTTISKINEPVGTKVIVPVVPDEASLPTVPGPVPPVGGPEKLT